MASHNIPGATGQPPENYQGPSMDTMRWLHTTSPKVDYAEGNPGQETSPAEMKPWSNDSEPHATTPTANDKNGGKDMFDGGGTG